jgi:hypothetical protein
MNATPSERPLLVSETIAVSVTATDTPVAPSQKAAVRSRPFQTDSCSRSYSSSSV